MLGDEKVAPLAKRGVSILFEDHAGQDKEQGPFLLCRTFGRERPRPGLAVSRGKRFQYPDSHLECGSGTDTTKPETGILP